MSAQVVVIAAGSYVKSLVELIPRRAASKAVATSSGIVPRAPGTKAAAAAQPPPQAAPSGRPEGGGGGWAARWVGSGRPRRVVVVVAVGRSGGAAPRRRGSGGAAGRALLQPPRARRARVAVVAVRSSGAPGWRARRWHRSAARALGARAFCQGDARAQLRDAPGVVAVVVPALRQGDVTAGAERRRACRRAGAERGGTLARRAAGGGGGGDYQQTTARDHYRTLSARSARRRPARVYPSFIPRRSRVFVLLKNDQKKR